MSNYQVIQIGSLKSLYKDKKCKNNALKRQIYVRVKNDKVYKQVKEGIWMTED